MKTAPMENLPNKNTEGQIGNAVKLDPDDEPLLASIPSPTIGKKGSKKGPQEASILSPTIGKKGSKKRPSRSIDPESQYLQYR